MISHNQTFEQYLNSLPPEHQAEVKAGAARMARAMPLRQIRERLGLSQHAVAEELGTTQGEISKIENRNDLKVSTLSDFADALGGQLEILVHVNGEAFTVLVPSMIADDPD